MPKYLGTPFTGSDFEDRVAANDAAIRAAFGPKPVPYEHQEYPKYVSKFVDGVPVEATVYSKEQEDAFHAVPVVEPVAEAHV